MMTNHDESMNLLETEILERRLRELVAREALLKDQRRAAVESRMREIEPRRERFERVVQSWMRRFVLPRLATLGRVLPRASSIDHVSGTLVAKLKFPSTGDVPLGATVTVSIKPADDYRRARVQVEPELIPMLAGNPSAMSRIWDLEPADPVDMAGFLDDGMVAFANAYLEATTPGSPYRRGTYATDPVCGMSLIPAEAAEMLEHGGHRYYFCASSCADRFRETPERWIATPRES